MDRPGFAGSFRSHLVGVDRNEIAGPIPIPAFFRSLLRGLFLGDFANDGLGFLIGLVEEGLLTRQFGLNLSGQLEPLFFRSGLEVSQGTDDLLPRPLGGMPRFDQEIVGVGLTSVVPGGRSDVRGHYTTTKALFCPDKSAINSNELVTIFAFRPGESAFSAPRRAFRIVQKGRKKRHPGRWCGSWADFVHPARVPERPEAVSCPSGRVSPFDRCPRCLPMPLEASSR